MKIMKFWHRIPLIIRAILVGLLVSTIGVASWSFIGMMIPMPWSVILMAIILYVYWQFFNGSTGPVKSKERRRNNFRRHSISRSTWLLSFIAAALIVLFEQSGLIITFRMIEFPAEKFLMEYDFIENVPRWAGWLAIIMISTVAGICEEAGFRGYMQVQLEKRYSAFVSIAIVSVVFVLVHLHQAWSGPILVHIFSISILFGTLAYHSRSLIPGIIAHIVMDVFNFSFWWTDLGGQFDKQTIHSTGIDIHFILWSMVFIISTLSFILTIRKIRSDKMK
jgi:membrane protease YdiL (CAAX protease family)